MQTDIIGNRLKNNYENIPKTRLMRRCPVAIRIDGKSFHTFTRYFKKPFDDILRESMMATMKYLCENIQGCVFGYTQSDEITLILIDYQKLNTSAWFDYEVQKMCSISASMATMAFNKEFAHQVRKYKETHITGSAAWWDSYNDKYYQIIYAAMNKGAMFDARCFNIPKEEVTNLLYWSRLTPHETLFRWSDAPISLIRNWKAKRTTRYRICCTSKKVSTGTTTVFQRNVEQPASVLKMDGSSTEICRS